MFLTIGLIAVAVWVSFVILAVALSAAGSRAETAREFAYRPSKPLY